MAARAPTGPTQYVDKSAVVPPEEIIFTAPNQVVQDQHFIIQRQQQLVCDAFEVQAVQSASYREVARCFATFDRCNSGATGTFYWCAYGWKSAASNFDYQVSELGGVTSGSITVSASQTSQIWRGWGSITAYDDGTENEFVLYARAASGTVYTAGFGLFTG